MKITKNDITIEFEILELQKLENLANSNQVNDKELIRKLVQLIGFMF